MSTDNMTEKGEVLANNKAKLSLLWRSSATTCLPAGCLFVEALSRSRAEPPDNGSHTLAVEKKPGLTHASTQRKSHARGELSPGVWPR